MLRIHRALLAMQFDTEKKVQKRGARLGAHHAVAHKDDAMIDFLLENTAQVHARCGRVPPRRRPLEGAATAPDGCSRG